MGGCTGSSSLSGLVIGVLSVSWSSELLLSFSALTSTSTPLLTRTTSSPLTHDQRTQCYWPTLYFILHALCMGSLCTIVCVRVCMGVHHGFIRFHSFVKNKPDTKLN